MTPSDAEHHSYKAQLLIGTSGLCEPRRGREQLTKFGLIVLGVFGQTEALAETQRKRELNRVAGGYQYFWM